HNSLRVRAAEFQGEHIVGGDAALLGHRRNPIVDTSLHLKISDLAERRRAQKLLSHARSGRDFVRLKANVVRLVDPETDLDRELREAASESLTWRESRLCGES